MTSLVRLFSGASAALVSLCLLTSAASALSIEDDYNNLMSVSPDVSAGQPVTPPPPTLSTAVPSVELSNFWEKLRNGVGEPLCKKAEVNLSHNQKFADDAIGIKGGVRRAIRRFPDSKLALLDEVRLSFAAGLGEQSQILSEMGELNLKQNAAPPEATVFRMGLSGRLEGKSQVVRPLESQRFCKEVLEWAKFYELKTVLPAKAKRIVKMEIGEIWKLPLTMRMSFSVGAGASIAQVVNISLSAGMSKESKPSVSLRRLDADRLRLRLRLDRLEVVSVGIAASSVQIPLDAMGLENAGALAADLLSKAVPKVARQWVTAEAINKPLLKEINKYLSVKLSFGHSRFSGKKLLLEFILNPNNAEQMAELEEFLRGDFGIINRFMELGLKLSSFREEDDAIEGMGGIEDVAEQAGGVLSSKASFAGTDIYKGRSNTLALQVPVVGNNNVVWGKSYHRYQSLGAEGEIIHAYQKSRASNNSTFNIPFKGTIFKHNSQKDVYVLNKESADGAVTRPVFLYQQYEGLIRRGDGAVESVLEKANGVLRYVGVNGNGTDNSNQIPVGDVLASSKRYTAGVMSFKLLLNEQGVQDVLFAPAQAVMKAYMNIMRELYADIIDKVMGLFKFDKKGAVTYNSEAARQALGISAADEFAQGCNPLEIMDNLAHTATRVISDIAGVRDADTWQAQSERLAGVAGGASKSGLKYEDFLKVMVQLTRPGNVSASVYVHLDPKKKHMENVTQTHTFFDSRNNSYDATLSGVTQMRERFADPAELSD